jgi:hypothetical protein
VSLLASILPCPILLSKGYYGCFSFKREKRVSLPFPQKGTGREKQPFPFPKREQGGELLAGFLFSFSPKKVRRGKEEISKKINIKRVGRSF